MISVGTPTVEFLHSIYTKFTQYLLLASNNSNTEKKFKHQNDTKSMSDLEIYNTKANAPDILHSTSAICSMYF